MEINHIKPADAPLYIVLCGVSRKKGVYVKIKALTSAEKKNKIWTYDSNFGKRNVSIDKINKIDEELFRKDSIKNFYKGYCLKEDLKSFVEKIILKQEETLKEASNLLNEINFAIKTNHGATISEVEVEPSDLSESV